MAFDRLEITLPGIKHYLVKYITAQALNGIFRKHYPRISIIISKIFFFFLTITISQFYLFNFDVRETIFFATAPKWSNSGPSLMPLDLMTTMAPLPGPSSPPPVCCVRKYPFFYMRLPPNVSATLRMLDAIRV